MRSALLGGKPMDNGPLFTHAESLHVSSGEAHIRRCYKVLLRRRFGFSAWSEAPAAAVRLYAAWLADRAERGGSG